MWNSVRTKSAGSARTKILLNKKKRWKATLKWAKEEHIEGKAVEKNFWYSGIIYEIKIPYENKSFTIQKQNKKKKKRNETRVERGEWIREWGERRQRLWVKQRLIQRGWESCEYESEWDRMLLYTDCKYITKLRARHRMRYFFSLYSYFHCPFSLFPHFSFSIFTATLKIRKGCTVCKYNPIMNMYEGSGS